MNQAPPGGGGWGGPHAAALDPYAAERAFAAWCAERGYELVSQPDVRAFQAWFPMQFMRPIASAVREVRVTRGRARISLVELVFADAIGQVVGETRGIVAFVLHPELRHRAALRSRSGGGITGDLSRGLKEVGDFFQRGLAAGPAPGSLLGDPVLEQRCELAVPSPQEGHLALPQALRQIVAHPSFQGLLELRAGGMVVQMFDLGALDASTTEQAVARLGQLIDAATSSAPGG